MSYNTSNQIASGLVTYDAAGNVMSDANTGNSYLYDGEGRICAVKSEPVPNTSTMIAYVYDAEGNRVAKGMISSWPTNGLCPNLAAAGVFTPTASYVLGPSNEQLTEEQLNPSGTWQWQHTNVYAAGTIIATYDAPSGTPALHFQLEDWLGSRRVQTNINGTPEESYFNLPFGDGLVTTTPAGAPATADDATEHHFTGKERDSESGNDYFGARYYSSAMGRFMSPDPGPFIWHDPQTLNRYAYTRNNPLKFVDPTGMYFVIDSGNDQARQAISMMLRSQTGRALVYSIAMDPRPTYVKQGRLPYERNGNKVFATKGLNESIYGNVNGQGVVAGTTVTIDWVNAALSANGSPLFWLILKAYAHELSHTADKNAAPNWGAADDAGKAGDKDANGNPCAGGGTECGSAESLALQILAELGNPGAYSPDDGSEAEAGGIIDQGNREENGFPPFALNPNSSSGRKRPNGYFCPAEFSVCN